MAYRSHIGRARMALLGSIATVTLSGAAYAQDTNEEEDTLAEEVADGQVDAEGDILVTGTLIRGIAPQSSETVSLGREEIEAVAAISTSQLIAEIPQSGDFNSQPIVSSINSTQITINRPNLRGLPGDSGGGSSTLVLLDGHRLPGMGIRQTVPDPDAIAPGAIERVEVVLDGGSSIYGADAVGGVINFITRKRFDGLEVDGQYGFGDEYQSFDTNVTAGKAWDSASIYVSYNYAWHDSLYGRDRDYVRRRDYVLGVANDLTCNPGNVQIGASIYGLPGLTSGAANRCDLSDDSTFYPSEERHSVLVGASLDDGGPVTFDVKAFYTHRVNKGNGGPIDATVTIDPSSPFYQSTGDANGAATQSVLFDFSPILGNDTDQRVTLETYGFTPTMNIDLGSDWQLSAFANYGVGTSEVANGKINDGTLSALVSAGQFNPYDLNDPANASLLPGIVDYLDYGYGRNELYNTRAVVDGPLLALPGGELRVALGGEYIREQYKSRIAGTVAADQIGGIPVTGANRTVLAAFGEAQVPIVGYGNRMPGIYSLDLSLSGRYDDYSDFGDTFNPKVGLTYRPVDWVSLRGTWGKSFQAPSLSDSTGAAPSTIFAFPFVLFANPDVAPTPGQAQIFLGGGGDDLEPQKSTTWSLGFDIEPPFIDGLTLNFNYYNIDFENLIDIPPVFNPGVFYALFPDNYIINPTAAQVIEFASQVPGGLADVAPYTASDGQVYAIADGRRTNLASVKTDGIDFSVRYQRDTGFGSIFGDVSGSYVLGRKEKPSQAAPYISTVNDYSRFKIAARLGAQWGDLRGQVTFKHLGGFDVAPLASNLDQVEVEGFNTVDLYLNYDLDGAGLLKDTSLSLNVSNLFDEDPPLYRGTINSLDGYAVPSIGRVTQIGISKTF